MRKTFCGHTTTLIKENLFLFANQSSLKEGLSSFVFQQRKFKLWYSLLSYQVVQYAVINISEEWGACVLRAQVHSEGSTFFRKTDNHMVS
jgi:hypothetical protein